MEGSGMKESEGDRLKYAVCESTLSTAARSPFPNGEGYETGKAVSSTQSLPRVGNAVKLSKILIAHASNSVCFFHALSLPVNNKIKKLVK